MHYVEYLFIILCDINLDKVLFHIAEMSSYIKTVVDFKYNIAVSKAFGNYASFLEYYVFVSNAAAAACAASQFRDLDYILKI